MRYEGFARSHVELPAAKADEALVAKVRKRLGPFCKPSPGSGAVYFSDQRRDFEAAMRRATLGYQLRSAQVRSALGPLALSPPADAPAPPVGVLTVWASAGTGAHALAPPADLFSADGTLLKAVSCVFAEGLWMRATALCDDDLGAISLPCGRS